MFVRVTKFKDDDEGAVTADWVLLTVFVTIAASAVLTVVMPGLNFTSGKINAVMSQAGDLASGNGTESPTSGAGDNSGDGDNDGNDNDDDDDDDGDHDNDKGDHD